MLSTICSFSKSEPDNGVAKYLASLTNFRSRNGLPEWTEEQKKACLLFKHARATVSELQIRRRTEEVGIKLTE